jgi:hypothetical protein
VKSALVMNNDISLFIHTLLQCSFPDPLHDNCSPSRVQVPQVSERELCWAGGWACRVGSGGRRENDCRGIPIGKSSTRSVVARPTKASASSSHFLVPRGGVRRSGGKKGNGGALPMAEPRFVWAVAWLASKGRVRV